MRYMGSKGRHVNQIVPLIMSTHSPENWYFEPFLGGGNIFSEIPAKKKFGSDTAKYAVALLEALSKGWEPPRDISEIVYQDVKEFPDSYPDELVGFVAYCCSYAGKFFGGYARGYNNKGIRRNFADEQCRNLEKQRKGLIGAKFSVCDYRDLSIPSGSTIYCDPPYANTTGYQNPFNHDYFWQWCYHHSYRGCKVYVSEYSAPPEWTCVWEKSVTSSLTRDTGSKSSTEKLFTIDTSLCL